MTEPLLPHGPFSDGYEGVTHAGVLIVARDSGAMLLAQRAMDENDAPEVAETWEMPGGSLNPGEDPLSGAWREYSEEVGGPIPAHEVVHGWRAGPEDNYQGFLVAVDEQFVVNPGFTDPKEVQNVRWVTPDGASTLNLRPEFAKLDLNALTEMVSGNEADMEPDYDFDLGPIPVHGVVAPEDVATGDGRGFNAGSMTRRPLRLPFSDQHVSIGGHDGSVVVGSVDRLMRKDGMVHWEGALMASADAEPLIERMEFFGGRYGVSVDGDNGSLDQEKIKATGVMWFDAVRAAGLTAVAIPAFHEAYVAFGHHPDMPEDDTDAVLAASGLEPTDIVGARVKFDRGPGWVTNPKETKTIYDYWTKPGEEGYAKVGWGTSGDFTRAKALIGAKIAANSPDKMRFLNRIIAQWHFDVLGYWPGDLGKPGNPPDTAENRRRAAAHAAAEHGIELNVDGAEWETVITSSAGAIALPPMSYFERHPDSENTVIEEPDENGIRRTYGYAAEWGVCHIGYAGRCVEPPMPEDGEFPEFHLGRTKTDAGYIKTGVMAYKVDHRDAETILSETAEQSHFDNVKCAWSAVRLGVDERGIWFSGYVLPGVPEEDIVLIEATGQVSGEWKFGALRALQSVNVPGFPVMSASAVLDDDGEVLALVASTVGNQLTDSPCEPTPAERMRALAQIDAEVRFERLREGWA